MTHLRANLASKANFSQPAAGFRFLIFFLLGASLCFSFCKNEKTLQKRDIRSFYFPMDAIENGLVYAYDAQNANGVKNTEYFLVEKIQAEDGSTLVNTTYYDPTVQPGYSLIERVVENGVIAEQIIFYEANPETGAREQVKGKIEAGNSFPFLVNDSSGILLYSVKWNPLKNPEASNYLIRNKKYHGDSRPFTFHGKVLKTVEFKSIEVVGSELEGSAELEGKSEQLFAEGLGLVYYKKSYKGFVQEFALADTFRYDELTKRARVFMMGK